MQVISAFDTPKLRYDPIRKVFYQIQGRPTLHGSSEVSISPTNWLHLQSLKPICVRQPCSQKGHAGTGIHSDSSLMSDSSVMPLSVACLQTHLATWQEQRVVIMKSNLLSTEERRN